MIKRGRCYNEVIDVICPAVYKGDQVTDILVRIYLDTSQFKKHAIFLASHRAVTMAALEMFEQCICQGIRTIGEGVGAIKYVETYGHTHDGRADVGSDTFHCCRLVRWGTV